MAVNKISMGINYRKKSNSRMTGSNTGGGGDGDDEGADAN